MFVHVCLSSPHKVLRLARLLPKLPSPDASQRHSSPQMPPQKPGAARCSEPSRRLPRPSGSNVPFRLPISPVKFLHIIAMAAKMTCR